MTRPTPTTVEVMLKDGMKWTTAARSRSRTRLFSLEAPGYGDKAPMYRPFVLNIAKVEITGPRTLRITLKRPDAAFLVSTLSKLNLAPKKVWAPIFEDLKNKPETAESIVEEQPISSGPYRLVRAEAERGDRAGAEPGPLGQAEGRALDHADHAEHRSRRWARCAAAS